MTLLTSDLTGGTTAQQTMRGDLVFPSMGECQEVRRRGGLDCRALWAAEISRSHLPRISRTEFSFCRHSDRHNDVL
jgi:hypothetical protein